jgi:tetratricopeptide (TPR) repeat protein
LRILGYASIQACRANSGLLVVFALTVLISRSTAYEIQQPPANPNKTDSSAKILSPIEQASDLIQQGRFADAAEILQDQIKQNPSRIDAYNLLGIAYAGEKDYGRATDAFQQALKLAPKSIKTHNNLGNLYVSQQKFDLAEKEFRQVLTVAPANRDANYNLGLLLLVKGSPSAAIQYFQQVHPLTVEARFNLVRAYLQAGKTAQAVQAAQELSSAHKQDIQLQFTLGVLLAGAKQYKAALPELERANELQPETFEILYNLGQAYLKVHDSAKADLTLNRALKVKPDSVDALHLLGEVYFEQSRPVDALDLLMRAHKLAPENTDVIYLMARVSMTQNYFEDAIPLLESGLKIAPQRPDLHAALGESYFMAGKTESAIGEFQKLVELDPSAASYAFMGLAYRHLGRFDEASKYFELGLKQDPHNASCLFNLGYIEERQGNYAAADAWLQKALAANPNFSETLLELANLRLKDKKYAEAIELLRRYVKVSRDPADGYYKLAMAERGLHQTEAAQRDLSVFQTLSKNSVTGTYPYQHLFDYLDNRSTLSAQERTQLDVTELTDQIQKHPGQPQNLYLLAEAYLKLGRVDVARETIAQLDQMSASDFRTQTGIGVLFARYRLYDDAIRHFQSALQVDPASDDVKFDLADAYFRKGRYSDALAVVQQVSAEGQKDDSFLSLFGDIEAHAGDDTKAMEVFREAILRSPDNDQYYLSLTLIQLRNEDLDGAEQTLQKGLARVPGSGKLIWGMGLVSVLQGDAKQAAERLERAVDLMPEWSGSYSTLGIFYYQIGQVDKAREVLNRFKGSNVGGLDVGRIEETLSKAPANTTPAGQPIPMLARQQVLQLALMIADRSL